MIEDDPAVADVLRLALESQGYTVDVAADGEEGLAYLQNHEAAAPRSVDLEFLAELKRPDMFQRLVDSLPPSVTRSMLHMWGLAHGVYTWTDEVDRDAQEQIEQWSAQQATLSPDAEV